MISLATWIFAMQVTVFPVHFFNEQGIVCDDCLECLKLTAYRPLTTFGRSVPAIGSIVEIIANDYRKIFGRPHVNLIMTVTPHVIIQPEEDEELVLPIRRQR